MTGNLVGRTRPIFVTSAFLDMQAESDYLKEHVFPELERRMRVTFQYKEPLVILWANDPAIADTEGLDNYDSLKTRLAEIESSTPVIIALLGDHSGSCPTNRCLEALKRNGLGISSYGEKSLTAIEIELGILANPEQRKRSRFYFRKPLPYHLMSSEKAAQYCDTFRADPESRIVSTIREAFKQKILKEIPGGVRSYDAQWDHDMEQVIGLDEWGAQVIEDLWFHIRQDFQVKPLLHNDSEKILEAEDSFPVENVQFTIYRPKIIAPCTWYDVLAFAHLEDLHPDASTEMEDMVEEVLRQAKKILGPAIEKYRDSTTDASQDIPRGSKLIFVPEMFGVEFNPSQVSFRWMEEIHRADFRMRAGTKMVGKMVRGRMSVFWGSILIADINFNVRVDGSRASHLVDTGPTPVSGRPYRKIFASYSHKDLQVVQQLEEYSVALGDRYLMDCKDLRGGEAWSPRLREMIEDADIFQLFWSNNSMKSEFVKQEWEHALSLNRSYFVRPVYWEEPFPELPESRIPPNELRRIHFQWIGAPKESEKSVQPDEKKLPGVFEKKKAPIKTKEHSWTQDFETGLALSVENKSDGRKELSQSLTKYRPRLLSYLMTKRGMDHDSASELIQELALAILSPKGSGKSFTGSLSHHLHYEFLQKSLTHLYLNHLIRNRDSVGLDQHSANGKRTSPPVLRERDGIQRAEEGLFVEWKNSVLLDVIPQMRSQCEKKDPSLWRVFEMPFLTSTFHDPKPATHAQLAKWCGLISDKEFLKFQHQAQEMFRNLLLQKLCDGDPKSSEAAANIQDLLSAAEISNFETEIKLLSAGRRLGASKSPISGPCNVACLPDGRGVEIDVSSRESQLWLIEGSDPKLISIAPNNYESLERSLAGRNKFSLIIQKDGKIRILAAGGWGNICQSEQSLEVGHDPSIGKMAFSGSSDHVAIASTIPSYKVLMWEWRDSGKEIQTLFEDSSTRCTCLAFSPDGNQLAIGRETGSLERFDISRNSLQEMQGHQDSVLSLVYSPDGQRLASGSKDQTVIINNAQGADALRLMAPGAGVTALAFSHDSRAIAGGSADGSLFVWEAATGAELLRLHGHKAPVESLAFTRDNKRIISASNDGAICVWDTWHPSLMD